MRRSTTIKEVGSVVKAVGDSPTVTDTSSAPVIPVVKSSEQLQKPYTRHDIMHVLEVKCLRLYTANIVTNWTV